MKICTTKFYNKFLKSQKLKKIYFTPQFRFTFSWQGVWSLATGLTDQLDTFTITLHQKTQPTTRVFHVVSDAVATPKEDNFSLSLTKDSYYN